MCSRQHCQIELRPGGVVCRDLGSANGTLVNNERINEVTPSPGDKITIGPIVFTLQIDGEPVNVAPAETPATPPAPPTDTDEELIPSGDEGEQEDEELLEGIALIGEDDDEDPLAALEALADEEESDEDDLLG
jgi:pSer/pThr/pTyr-binding forkhead associated (FHA) protein